MFHLCFWSVLSVSRAARILLRLLPAGDGLQIRLGALEAHLFLAQASLQVFVQVVSDRLSLSGGFVEILVHQVLQLGARVSFSEPAGDAVVTLAEGVEQVALISQIRSFGGHVLGHVVEEAALIAVEALGVSLLKDQC